LLLVGVEAGSPAAQAGLLVGDIVLRVAGERVRHPGQLAALLGDEAIGQTLPLSVVRAGALLELAVTVTERP
jgi:S1-C subfamily serine protease